MAQKPCSTAFGNLAQSLLSGEAPGNTISTLIMENLWNLSTFDASLGYSEVDPSLVAQAQDSSVRIIDVRDPDEYHGELGHLEHSNLVPLSTISFTSQNWDRECTYLMVCRSGNRSGKAATMLVELGFEQVINLKGGMLAQRAFENA